MASVKQLALDNLVTTLETITTANSYNTDIQKVIMGKIVPLEKMPSQWRQAVCQIRFSHQTVDRDSHDYYATITYMCHAAMSNATSDSFMMFLDDIEASVSKDPSRNNLQTDDYNVLDTWVERIHIVDTEEWDEVLDTTSKQHKDLEAIIMINVFYVYIPDTLSG